MAEGRTGTLTVVFTDVVASTAMRERLGDERGSLLLRRVDEVVGEVAVSGGGRLVKVLGDGHLLAFDSVRDALGFATSIHRLVEDIDPDERLRLRVGVHTGEVTDTGDDLDGQAVHAASRISDVAEPGQTWTSEVVKLLGDGVDGVIWTSVGEHALKGFASPWTLQHASAPGNDGASLDPLVGRRRERAQLRDAMDALAKSEGGITLIIGEPGVGKSRLARHAMALADQRDLRVLHAACRDEPVPTPYGPVIDLFTLALHEVEHETIEEALAEDAGALLRLVPEVALLRPDLQLDPLPPDHERRMVFAAIERFLRRAGDNRPMVLMVDDVQWTDEASAKILEYLADRYQALGVHLITTMRTVGLERPELASLAGAIGRSPGGQVMRLDVFDAEDVADQLEALVGTPAPPSVVAAVQQRTGGLPFFVAELVDHLVRSGTLVDGAWPSDLDKLGIPENARVVLEERLAGLGEEVGSVLEAVAVLDDHAAPRLLSQILDRSLAKVLDALETAEHARVIRVEDLAGHTRIRFAHDLVRETVLGQLGVLRLQRLHLAAAEAHRETDRDSTKVAQHLVQAGSLADPNEVAEALVVAAELAMDRVAPEDAASSLSRAVELLGDAPSTVRGRALLMQSNLAFRDGDVAAAKAAVMRAGEVFRAVGDEASALRAAIEFGSLAGWTGDLLTGAEMNESAKDLDGPTVLLAANRAARAGTLHIAGMFDEGLELEREALRLFASADIDEEWYSGITGRMFLAHNAMARGQAYAAREVLAPVVERVDRIPESQYDVLGWWASACFLSGDSGPAIEWGERVLEVGQRLQLPNVIVMGARTSQVRLWWSGRVSETLPFSDIDIEVCTRVGLPYLGAAHAMRGIMHWMMGDLDEAARCVELGRATDIPGAWGGAPEVLDWLVRASRGDGLVDATFDGIGPNGIDSEYIYGGMTSHVVGGLEALLLAGRRDLVATALPLLERWYEQGARATFWMPGRVAVAAALASACAGDLSRAQSWLDRSVDDVDDATEQLLATDNKRWQAWLWLEDGDPARVADARSLAEEAAADYARYGMRTRVEMARRLAVPTG